MFVVLCFFGLSALILGILQIGNNIKISSYTAPTTGADNLGAIQFSDDDRSIDELRASDTDNDGLSDFDEMYVYKTSMYLSDTDSDGYDDKDEIDQGYDPNCPKGQDCRGTGVDTSEPLVDSNDIGQLPADNPLQDLVDTGDGDIQTGINPEIKQQLEQLTPLEVRQLLLSSGEMTTEQLDQVDDDTLMDIFEQVLNQ